MDDQPPVPDPTKLPPPPSAPPPPPPLAPPPIITPPPPPRARSGVIWKVLTLVFLVLFALSLIANAFSFSRGFPRATANLNAERQLEEITLQHTNNTDNKIAVVDVNGIISSGNDNGTDMSMVEYIRQQFRMAERDSDVKAVILKVNSPGGEVLASDEINKIITRFQNSSHKPVITSMQALAASGGYYISVPCRWIVANELTITGSIGVIMHDYNYRLLLDKVGVRPHVFKSGRFKDMLSGEQEPDTGKLPPEEQQTRQDEDRMVQVLIDQTYDRFKQVVQQGRDNAAKENNGEGKSLVDDWQDYADGRILSGKQALNFGFVDELGDFETAVKRAKKISGISSASLVAYRVPFDLGSVLSRVFGKSQAPAIKVDFGVDLPKLQAGLPYYILPTAVLH